MRLIVGIDPGATMGVAIMDANCSTRMVETISKRNFSYSEIVDWLSGKGEPIIVATDKKQIPLMARRVAAAFGARLCSPREDMKRSDKNVIVERSKIKIRNDHEADALAAALFAKIQFMDIFEKVERNVDAGKQGAVKKLLVTGQAANIEIALEMLETRRKQGIGRERRRERDRFAAGIAKELEDARKRNSFLEKEIFNIKRQILEKRYQRNESLALKRLRESSIKVLFEKDKIIKELEKIIEGQHIIVVYYGAQTEEETLGGKAVILDRGNDMDVRKIERAGAFAIISDLDIRSSLPVIRKGKANIRSAGKFLVMDRPEEKENFEEWLNAYKYREIKKIG